jgi:hypothetical protein
LPDYVVCVAAAFRRRSSDGEKLLIVEQANSAYYHLHLLADIFAGRAVGPP